MIAASKNSSVDDASIAYKKEASDRLPEDGLPGVQEVDEVFGVIKEDGPNYRGVGWKSAGILMTKAQAGLGILNIPSVLHTLGMVPGVLCLLGIATFSAYSNYEIGRFKRAHPSVYSVDDAAFLIGGKVGREIIGVVTWLYMTLTCSSGLLSISIGLNVISKHATCTAAWTAIGAVIAFVFASIRTLGKISYLGWIGLASILISVITLTIAVGVADRPAAAPATGPYDKDIRAVAQPSFHAAITAVSNLLFAFGASPSYYGISSEMRLPKLYNRSMIMAQVLTSTIYIIIGVLVYVFVGQYVSSPSLLSGGPLMGRIAYGLAMPGLFVSCIMWSHLPAKWIFVRMLRNSRHLTTSTPTHYLVWFTCTFSCVAFSYIIASAVPVFSGLSGLVGALFGSILVITMQGFMWFYDHWELRKTDKSVRYRLMLAWNIFVILIGTFLMVGGTYGSVVDIKESKTRTSPWSCADNSTQ